MLCILLALSPLIKVTIWLSGTVYEASRCTGGNCAPVKRRDPMVKILELSNSCKSALLLLIPLPSLLQNGARNSSCIHPCCASNGSTEQDFAYFFSSHLLIFNNTNKLPPTSKRPQQTNRQKSNHLLTFLGKKRQGPSFEALL